MSAAYAHRHYHIYKMNNVSIKVYKNKKRRVKILETGSTTNKSYWNSVKKNKLINSVFKNQQENKYICVNSYVRTRVWFIDVHLQNHNDHGTREIFLVMNRVAYTWLWTCKHRLVKNKNKQTWIWDYEQLKWMNRTNIIYIGGK